MKKKHTVDVDTGTIIAIDPAYIFSEGEWKTITQCAYPDRGKKTTTLSTFKSCIRKALQKRGASAGAPHADFTLINTGGDGRFEASCKRGKFAIDELYKCDLLD
jgi:hypothetical protein